MVPVNYKEHYTSVLRPHCSPCRGFGHVRAWLWPLPALSETDTVRKPPGTQGCPLPRKACHPREEGRTCPGLRLPSLCSALLALSSHGPSMQPRYGLWSTGFTHVPGDLRGGHLCSSPPVTNAPTRTCVLPPGLSSTSPTRERALKTSCQAECLSHPIPQTPLHAISRNSSAIRWTMCCLCFCSIFRVENIGQPMISTLII